MEQIKHFVVERIFCLLCDPIVENMTKFNYNMHHKDVANRYMQIYSNFEAISLVF